MAKPQESRETIFRKGLDILYPPKRPLPSIEGGGQGNLISEFVGMSGVGKSTLCRYYTDHYAAAFDRKIMTVADFAPHQQGNRHFSYKKNDFYKKLDQHRRSGIILKTHSEWRHKINRLRYSRRILDRDILIKKYYRHKIFILDQHIFQNLFWDINSILRETAPEDFMKDRLLIACRAPVSRVVKNIKKRQTQREARAYYAGLSEDKLRKKVERTLVRWKKKTEILKSKGWPVLEVDTAANLSENLLLIDDFIHTFIKKEEH